VTWWEKLDDETLKRLDEKYPNMTFDQMAVEAMRKDPKAFEGLDVKVTWMPADKAPKEAEAWRIDGVDEPQ
jgi:hypothetical protein